MAIPSAILTFICDHRVATLARAWEFSRLFPRSGDRGYACAAALVPIFSASFIKVLVLVLLRMLVLEQSLSPVVSPPAAR